MPPCLKNCPPEIIEAIVVLLGLDDIRSLRQTCRSLAAKSTQNHFKSYYRSKHVDITADALKALVDATQPGRLGCLVQELILVCLPSTTDNAYGQNSNPQYIVNDTDLSLLSQAFSNISANGRNRKFMLLSLEVRAVVRNDLNKCLTLCTPRHPRAVCRGPPRLICQSAIRTFHTAIRALAASRLPLEKLDVFHQAQGCSLPWDELDRVDFQDSGLAISLSSLKSLSVGLSNSITYQPSKENLIGIGAILQTTRLLESLELHYYQLYPRDCIRYDLPENSDFPDEHILKASSCNLPKLKQCWLLGICTSDVDLLAFIRRTAIRRLFMEEVKLASGKFNSVFDYCTTEAAGIEELYFNKLFDDETQDGLNLVYFHTTGQIGHAQCRISLQRAGAEVKQPIVYHYQIGRPRAIARKVHPSAYFRRTADRFRNLE